MIRLAILGDGLVARSAAEAADKWDGIEARIFTHADLDIIFRDRVAAALDGYDVAINTVALHKLGECENDPQLAALVNTVGAGNVASVLPTIYISTDYVFNAHGPHDETMPGDTPKSVYGKTKLGGEIATLEQGGTVVRISSVFGHHRSHKGPTFPEMVSSSFDPIKLPTDQRFCPTYAPDAAGRIVWIANLIAGDNGGGGIYHAANAGSTSWAEFAEQVCEVLPWKRHVIPYEAHDRIRPTNSVLRSSRLAPLRHWRFALDEWANRVRAERYVSPRRGGL